MENKDYNNNPNQYSQATEGNNNQNVNQNVNPNVNPNFNPNINQNIPNNQNVNPNFNPNQQPNNFNPNQQPNNFNPNQQPNNFNPVPMQVDKERSKKDRNLKESKRSQKNDEPTYKGPIVVFENFKKRFKSNQIGPITFHIEPGKFVALLGSSGSGKTVVLNSMMGVIKKYDGTIIFDGYNRRKRNSYRANQNIGIYQQMDFSLETLSCYDYLINYCTYTGVKKQYRADTIKFWLDFFELWPAKDKLLKNFSWGMKNRVNLMLCFLRNPNVYILDEPGANLDSIWRGKINELFRQLKNLNKTLIISSHNIDELVDLIDYYVVLLNGKKIFEGHKDEIDIYRKYKIILLEQFDIEDFREFCKAKNLRAFKYDPTELSVIFATNNLIEINWAFLYFIKKGVPILNVTKLPINMESIHKALEAQIEEARRDEERQVAESTSKKRWLKRKDR